MQLNTEDTYRQHIIEPNDKMSLTSFLLTQKRYPVISVTWPAWVGKSTITNILSKLLWWKIYTELPEYNPFLSIIKETKWKVSDIMLWGNNQNFFLATDVAQITKWFIESRAQPIIFDFALTQPFIFSDMNLNWDFLSAFNAMYKEQFATLPKPDIVIEIKADDGVIIDRLKSRWKHIDEFVIKMVEQLNGYYKSWIVDDNFGTNPEETKVIVLDNNVFMSPEELQNKLKTQVFSQIQNLTDRQ